MDDPVTGRGRATDFPTGQYFIHLLPLRSKKTNALLYRRPLQSASIVVLVRFTARFYIKELLGL